MSHRDEPRLPADPPTVPPPPPFRERRVSSRRAADREAHRERVLLARVLDILAGEGSGEERLAGLLDLLARTAGAARAAVIADGTERRSAVVVGPNEDPAAAEALAAWLDASAGRSRAERAASGPAPVSLVVRGAGRRPAEGAGETAAGPAASPRVTTAGEERTGERVGEAAVDGGPVLVDETGGRWYVLLPIPSAGRVYLGFEFARSEGPDALGERLSPQLARHAAVGLALVTEQLARERELVSLRAEETERRRFVSTVVHELRTPLTGLQGYLELILGGKVDDPEIERDFLERSRGIVGSMADLVGDLLELSRLESGTVGLAVEQFSVAEAGSRVAANLMPIALERGSRLTTSLPPRLRSATGDRRRVEQILTNLAGNALKFTPAGGTVEIDGRFDGPVALFVVRDDGPGIAPEDRARIFERFHRLAGHERITGTGLGLPIARDLARRMDGGLEVASVAGAGSAFVLALPGPAAVDAHAVAEVLERAISDEEARLQEAAVLRAVGRARSAGRESTGRTESAAAVAAQKKTERTGDAPPASGSDGTEAAEHLRALPRRPGGPAPAA
jgi:signal transduction histidine kinase